MQVCNLKLLLEHHGRLLELMQLHCLKVMALNEKELTLAEIFLEKKVRLSIQDQSLPCIEAIFFRVN